MINEYTKATGEVNILLLDEHGKIKQEVDAKNLIVTTGLDHIASRMLSNADSVMSHMAVGTGATPVAAGNTTLETELARVALTSATAVGSIITYIGNYPAGTGTGNLTEAGIFNAGAVGTMLNRVTFGSVNKGALDTMIITWTLTIG